MGYFRFFLAFLVMLSHLGMGVYGLNPGVVAVVCFYILAGKVVSKLFLKKIDISSWPKRLFTFWVERSLRIFPVYLFILGLTILFLLLTHFGQPEFTPYNLFLNLLIIPTNYYMFLGKWINVLKGIEPNWYLIPTAWSLGLELQAYFLLSLVLISPYLTGFAFGLSFFIYVLSTFGLIHSELFGYRLVIGVFFLFIYGHFLEKYLKKESSFKYGLLILLIYVAMVGLGIYHILIKPNYLPFVRETLTGFIGGVPIIYVLEKYKKRLPLNTLLADMSYPFFLSHFLSFWILSYLKWFPVSFLDKAIYSTLLTLLISLCAVGMESPIKNIRYKLVAYKKITPGFHKTWGR